MPLAPGVEAALAVCIVVVGHGGRWILSVVRTTRLATAYLGAVCDARGRPLDWVELWFPHDEQDEADPGNGACCDHPGPLARWRALVQRWERSASSGFIQLGWEAGLPRPLVLQTDSLSWFAFTDPATGRVLQFCRDDAALSQAGLPLYSCDTAVFLSADNSNFFLAAGKIVDRPTQRLDELLPKHKPFIIVSATGRSMVVRRFAPLALGDYADILAGAPLLLDAERQEAVRLAFGGGALGSGPGFLTTAHRSLLRARAGRKEWMAEIIALKMRLLSGAIQQVLEGIAVTREPFLSLSEHAFAIRFGLAGPPFQLWDFEVVLHATGCASTRQAAGTGVTWRALHESQMPPAYERRSAGRQLECEVECRLRLVTRQKSQVLVEATLGRCEQINFGGMLGRLHLALATGRHIVWGRLSRESSLARDEIRFTSFPADCDESVATELERMQGFVWNNVLLDVRPAVGYGDDLHSLAVLAVRLLFTSEARQLPAALDAVLSVIERLRETPAAKPLAAQVRAAFDREPRFGELLHPGRAVTFPISSEDAIASLGESGWWEVLAFVLRLFPSDLPGAFCHSEEVADRGVYPRAFDAAISTAEALNRRLVDQVMPHETINLRIRTITDALRRTSGL